VNGAGHENETLRPGQRRKHPLRVFGPRIAIAGAVNQQHRCRDKRGRMARADGIDAKAALLFSDP